MFLRLKWLMWDFCKILSSSREFNPCLIILFYIFYVLFEYSVFTHCQEPTTIQRDIIRNISFSKIFYDRLLLIFFNFSAPFAFQTQYYILSILKHNTIRHTKTNKIYTDFMVVEFSTLLSIFSISLEVVFVLRISLK
jgi:hypothetical protein